MPAGFSQPVRRLHDHAIWKPFRRDATLERLQPIFEAGRVAIVADESGFHGLITRVDVLNHLRRQAGRLNQDTLATASTRANKDRSMSTLLDNPWANFSTTPMMAAGGTTGTRRRRNGPALGTHGPAVHGRRLPAGTGAPRHGFGTRAIHAGQSPDPTTGAVMTPIYATSTYVQQSPGVHKGFDYGRSHNPTRFAFERCVADLENGTAGFAFASGLAAIGTVLELLDHGSHVLVCDDLYGGTYRLFERVRRRTANLDFTYVDPTDLVAFRQAIRPTTRMIWIETPSNPLLKLADLAAIGDIGPAVSFDHRGRQHLCHALCPAAAGSRLRHRGPFGDQISQRPLAT